MSIAVFDYLNEKKKSQVIVIAEHKDDVGWLATIWCNGWKPESPVSRDYFNQFVALGDDELRQAVDRAFEDAKQNAPTKVFNGLKNSSVLVILGGDVKIFGHHKTLSIAKGRYVVKQTS